MQRTRGVKERERGRGGGEIYRFTDKKGTTTRSQFKPEEEKTSLRACACCGYDGLGIKRSIGGFETKKWLL